MCEKDVKWLRNSCILQLGNSTPVAKRRCQKSFRKTIQNFRENVPENNFTKCILENNKIGRNTDEESRNNINREKVWSLPWR